MPDLRALCLTGIVLAAAPLAAQQAPTAVFTRVAGTITVDAPGPAARAPHRAAPMQVLLPGSVVYAPEAASAVIVCSTDRMVELRGPATWRLTHGGCDGGRGLEPRIWRSLEQAGGTPVELPQGFLEERRSRGSEEEGHPVFLSPRGRITGSDRPVLAWTAVEGAEAYEVRVQGVVTFSRRFSLAELSCGPEGGWRPDRPVTVCSAPWPEEERALLSGFMVWVRVLARGTGEASFTGSEEQVMVELVPGTDDAALAALPFDPALVWTLRGAAAFEQGRYGEAVEAYRKWLAEAEDAAGRVRLGDALAGLGLFHFAEAQYRHAETTGPEEVTEAARQRLALLERHAAQRVEAR